MKLVIFQSSLCTRGATLSIEALCKLRRCSRTPTLFLIVDVSSPEATKCLVVIEEFTKYSRILNAKHVLHTTSYHGGLRLSVIVPNGDDLGVRIVNEMLGEVDKNAILLRNVCCSVTDQAIPKGSLFKCTEFNFCHDAEVVPSSFRTSE
jgi:hypothetical protein